MRCKHCGCRLFKSTTTWLLDLDMHEKQNGNDTGTGFCQSRWIKEQNHDHEVVTKEEIVSKLLSKVDEM